VLNPAYVYLNDSGPVVFKHIGTDYGPATRPPTKAGGFRCIAASRNCTRSRHVAAASDFLRVEFKNGSEEPRSLEEKFFRESYSAGENFEKIQFENI
jgi:hypothetical protein